MSLKQFLSCDWGTTSFRLRLINADNGAVITAVDGTEGIAAMHALWLKSGLPDNERTSFYQKRLGEKIKLLKVQPGEGTNIFISGMASSSIGMMELPYAKLPFALDGSGIVMKRIEGDYPIFLFSGVHDQEDAMRGEETILLGIDLHSSGEQIAIMPGTHSKHTFITANKMIGIRSYMTGEVFELLSSKSILAASVGKPANNNFDNEYFEKGVGEGVTGNILNSIFHVRMGQLLNGISPEANYYYLSGLLIGTELKEIKNCGKPTHLISSQSLMNAYQAAIRQIVDKEQVIFTDADTALIAGHCKLARRFL
jgi:2-dehydro-3-deoxygalactonokinase